MRYINADKLIKDLNDLSEHYTDKGKEYHPHIDFVMDTVNQQPTADVRENVKGEWIEDNSREKSMMWRCSVCGRIAYYPTIGKRKSYKKHCGYNFCPNCGAEMRTD